MVVDIFSSKGSHMPFSRMLPDVLEELGIFALHFVFLCGILFLVKRFRSRLLALSAAFLMPFFQLFFVWRVSIHSEVFLSVALAFLLTVQIRLLDLIPFHTEDLLFLFAAFLFPARLFNSTSVLLGHLWLFWLIFCTYHTAVRLSLHSLRGNQFFCYLSFVVLSVSAYGFFLAIHFAVPFFQKAFGNHALALVAVTGLYLLLGAGAVWLSAPSFGGCRGKAESAREKISGHRILLFSMLRSDSFVLYSHVPALFHYVLPEYAGVSLISGLMPGFPGDPAPVFPAAVPGGLL